jgi:small subunit ribosomal protein S19e
MSELYTTFNQASVTLKDVAADRFIAAFAAHLKKSGKLEVPKWADLVKTATHKTLAPYDDDWFYIRCAAIARRTYLQPGVGVGSFNRVFGGPRQLGTHPRHFHEASGSVNRAALHALEKLKIVEKSGSGRRVTKTGKSELDRVAVQAAKQ